MRQFIVLGHDAPTDPDFSLSDLAGGAGRLDLLCRCVNAAVFLSHDIREAVRIHLVLRNAFAIEFDADSLRGLRPDERNIAGRIRQALEGTDDALGHAPADVSPGVSIYRMGLVATLDRVASDATLLQLHEDGNPVVDIEPPADPVFVLSDHRDFTADEADLLADRADERVRLGPERLHADHAISVAHNWLDTDGYTEY